MSICFYAYPTPDPEEHVFLREHTTAFIIAWVSGARPLYKVRVTRRWPPDVVRHDATRTSPNQ